MVQSGKFNNALAARFFQQLNQPEPDLDAIITSAGFAKVSDVEFGQLALDSIASDMAAFDIKNASEDVIKGLAMIKAFHMPFDEDSHGYAKGIGHTQPEICDALHQENALLWEALVKHFGPEGLWAKLGSGAPKSEEARAGVRHVLNLCLEQVGITKQGENLYYRKGTYQDTQADGKKVTKRFASNYVPHLIKDDKDKLLEAIPEGERGRRYDLSQLRSWSGPFPKFVQTAPTNSDGIRGVVPISMMSKGQKRKAIKTAVEDLKKQWGQDFYDDEEADDEDAEEPAAVEEPAVVEEPAAAKESLTDDSPVGSGGEGFDPQNSNDTPMNPKAAAPEGPKPAKLPKEAKQARKRKGSESDKPSGKVPTKAKKAREEAHSPESPSHQFKASMSEA